MIFALTLAAFALQAQAPADTAARIDSVMHQVQRLGAAHGDAIWPGYRPDTFAFLFVLPSRGAFLAGWRGSLPPGYTAVPEHPALAWHDGRDLGAASTGTELAGRPVAQVVASDKEAAALVSVAFHEAFHVFENLATKPGRVFGEHENAFYVSSYPVFNVDNEAAFALEGRLLTAALATRSTDDKRRLAQEFVATRRARHARVAPAIADFDRASEMNEALAEYALLRALELLAADGPPAWRAAARRDLDTKRAELADLTGNVNQSFRLRFYQTGPAIARLLDELSGVAWKTRVMSDNVDLQDALGHASGLDAAAEQALARVARAYPLPALRDTATQAVRRLEQARRLRADSALAKPGITLVMSADSLPSHDFGNCGFDPQNHLQVSPTTQLQTRWWKPCGGASTTAEFNVPSVHDAKSGTVTAVIGAEGDIRIEANGRTVQLADGQSLLAAANVKIEAPRASLQSARADLIRRGDVITVRPRP